MTDEELIRRCDVLEILDNEGSLGRTRKLVEQLAAITTEAQAAEIEMLRAKLTKAEAMLEREIMRVKKIQSELPPPHKVSLFSVQSEYELMLAELKGAKP